MRRGDAEDALVQYDALIAARPAFVDAYLGRSYALLLLGRLDAAERALVEAAEKGADRTALGAQRQLLTRRRSSPAIEQNR